MAVTKRALLDQLTRPELQAIADENELVVVDRRVRDQLVDAAASSRRVVLGNVLSSYSRHRLAELCRALKLDDSARERAALIEQLCKPRSATRVRKQAGIATPQQLRDRIARLSPSSPLTERFSRLWRSRDGVQQEQKVVWYSTQHEHWLGWLAGWSGSGAYGRKNWNRSAQFVYDHIVNPQMLVYLAEAAGVPLPVVKKASAAALTARTMMAMSAAIRKAVPWSMIEGALLRR